MTNLKNSQRYGNFKFGLIPERQESRFQGQIKYGFKPMLVILI